MDLKSKILLLIVFISIVISVAVMYDKYRVSKDFPIFESEDGIPDELEE